MTQSKKSLWTFSIGFLAFEGLSIGVLSFFSRLEQMSWVNAHHSNAADLIFQFFTGLAEVYLPIAFAIYLYKRKRNFFIPFLSSYALSTILVQGLKHLVFSHSLRPIAYFAQLHLPWHLVPGVEIHTQNSFPSGHTAAGWFMFFWFALLGKSRFWGIFLSLLACGVAYSRLYLMQHFPVDIAVGAFIGFSSSALVYYYMIYKPHANHVKDAA